MKKPDNSKQRVTVIFSRDEIEPLLIIAKKENRTITNTVKHLILTGMKSIDDKKVNAVYES